MKKYLNIILALAATVLLFSCAKESVNPYEQVPTLPVKYIESQLEYSPEAAQGIIVIDTEETLKVTSDRDWCVPTVDGNIIKLALTANAGKINRYAQLFVKSSTSSVDLSIVQYGEILQGLSSLSDVTAPVEGSVLRIPVDLNVNVVFETDADWVHPEGTAKELTITVDPNPNPLTRFCIVNYTAGSYQGSFEVVQYPELKQNDDWAVSLAETTFNYPKFAANTDVTVAAEDMYVVRIVPKSAVETDLKDYIFSTLAVSARREILALMASTGAEFKDFLQKGAKTVEVEDVAVGDSYAIAIGFAENGYVTGLYQYAEIAIEDIRPAYYKWAGEWKLSGNYLDGSSYSENITIEVDESDVDDEGNLKEARLIVRGLCSKGFAAAGGPEGSDLFYLKYSAKTGAVTFYGQNSSVKFTHSSLGSGCYVQIMSMYIKAGATAYTNATGWEFLSATMEADNTAKITILERSAGLPWKAFRMRLVNASGSTYTLGGGNPASVSIDGSLTMVRVK